ncbi:MAG: DUF2292 domain-containing protein [Chloroflexi bacterium]|nr:DUF2292 domain-containing protein [Chloroflexota bacterium]
MPEAPPDAREQAVLAEILQSIRALRHGHVQVIVQDGRVVQIDTLEKKRFGRAV